MGQLNLHTFNPCRAKIPAAGNSGSKKDASMEKLGINAMEKGLHIL